jgi:flagellar hook-length control protein FliK
MNNQDQGSSTFSDLLGQNITLTKEVVVQNEVKQVLYQQISTKEVIDQIVTKAVVKLTPDKTSMQLQLNPGHLGKVSVSVTSEQGLVKSQFVAENQVVKEMLEANMIQLKEQLEEQGIKVDKIEVTVGDTNQYFNQKDQQEQQSKHASRKSSRSRVGSVASISEVDEIEAVTNQPQSVLDSGIDIHTVEYSA